MNRWNIDFQKETLFYKIQLGRKHIHFKECYENRIIEAFKGTTQRLYNIGDAFFNGSKPKENKVKLYGAIPALAKVDGKPFHDMKKLVKFQKDSNLLKGGFLYQMEDYQK